MKHLFLLILLWFGLLSLMNGQGPVPQAPFKDSNYIESVASIQFHLDQFPLRVPVVNQSGRLTLEFDDLNANARDFTYRLIHCNGEWTKSQLGRSEFVRGYDEEEIDNYKYSSQTNVPYVHYSLSLPNNDMQWLVSGNYVLVVYLNDNPRQIAFTRRFVVVENRVKVNAEFVNPLDISRSDSHHEIKFTINYEDFQISDPMNEIKTTVIKNWRWDKARMLYSPRYTEARNIVYNQNGRFIFPAGNEHRPLDIRSMEYRAPNIYSINHTGQGIEVVVETDVIRAHKNYLDYQDINGRFIILNRDREGFGQATTAPDREDIASNQRLMYQHTESEYARVYFTLEAPQTLRNPIYLTGGFANWNALPRFRLEFDPAEQIYYTSAYLKQGYYDYYYAEKLPNGNLESVDIEGNYFETENEYLILVYYRPFGGRYDRVIASTSLISG